MATSGSNSALMIGAGLGAAALVYYLIGAGETAGGGVKKNDGKKADEWHGIKGVHSLREFFEDIPGNTAAAIENAPEIIGDVAKGVYGIGKRTLGSEEDAFNELKQGHLGDAIKDALSAPFNAVADEFKPPPPKLVSVPFDVRWQDFQQYLSNGKLGLSTDTRLKLSNNEFKLAVSKDYDVAQASYKDVDEFTIWIARAKKEAADAQKALEAQNAAESARQFNYDQTEFVAFLKDHMNITDATARTQIAQNMDYSQKFVSLPVARKAVLDLLKPFAQYKPAAAASSCTSLGDRSFCAPAIGMPSPAPAWSSDVPAIESAFLETTAKRWAANGRDLYDEALLQSIFDSLDVMRMKTFKKQLDARWTGAFNRWKSDVIAMLNSGARRHAKYVRQYA